MSNSSQDYKTLLTNIIKEQIIILGPAITLAKVRHVRGISVADDGTVTSLSEKPAFVISQLHDQFSELSSFIAKKALTPVLQQPQPASVTPPEEDTEQKEEQHATIDTGNV